VVLCALVSDLMDRSRIAAAVPEARFVRSAAECADADVIVVDLTRGADAVAQLRQTAPTAKIVAYGPHVETDGFAQTRAAGADVVLPRSRFFRDVNAALA
jgi:DNA-binding NarL/FixJ family response regulator